MDLVGQDYVPDQEESLVGQDYVPDNSFSEDLGRFGADIIGKTVGAVSKGAAQVIPYIGKSISGGLEATKDFYPAIEYALGNFGKAIRPLTDSIGNARDEAQQLIDNWSTEKLQNIDQNSSVAPGSGWDVGANIIGRGLPTMAAATLTGGAAIPAMLSGLQTSGIKYDELKDKGADPISAAEGSGIAGATDAATNLIKLPKAVEESFSPMVSRYGDALFSGSTSGALNEGANMAADYVGAGVVPENPEDRLLAAATTGAITSGVMRGASDLLRGTPGTPRADGLKQETLDTPDLPTRLMQIEDASSKPVDEMNADLKYIDEKIALPEKRNLPIGEVLDLPTNSLIQGDTATKSVEDIPSVKQFLPQETSNKVQEVTGEETAPKSKTKEVKSILGNEKGAINAQPLLDKISEAGKAISDFHQSHKSMETRAREMGADRAKEYDRSFDMEKYLSGEKVKFFKDENGDFVFKGKQGYGKRQVRNAMTQPVTIAKYDQAFSEGLYRPALEREQRLHEVSLRAGNEAISALDSLTPAEYELVNNYVSETDSMSSLKPGYIETVDKMKAYGLNDNQIQAVGKIRQLFNNYAPRVLKEAMVNDLAAKEKVSRETVLEYYDQVSAAKDKIEQSLATYVNSKGNQVSPAEIEVQRRRLYEDAGFSKSKIDSFFAIEKIDDVVNNKLKNSLYSPHGRYGEYRVMVLDKITGKNKYDKFFDRDSEAKDTISKLRSNEQKVGVGEQLDFNPQTDEIVFDRVPEVNSSSYNTMPLSVMEIVASFDPEAKNIIEQHMGGVTGFSQRLLKRKNIPGYEKDLKRNIADYSISLGSLAANQEFRAKSSKAIYELGVNKKPVLQKYSQDYQNYILSSADEGGALKKAMFNYFIAGKVSSAVYNLTQSGTMTLPIMAKYTDGVAAKWTRAHKQAAEYQLNSEKFIAKNKELGEFIKQAYDDGIVSDKNFREMAGLANNKNPSKFQEFLAGAFTWSEKYNRLQALIAGYDIGKNTKKLQGTELRKFAEDFVLETQGDYSKVNRPVAARGMVGSNLATFRLYQYNYVKHLKDSLSDKQFKTFAGMMAAPLVIGGLQAVPFAGIVLKSLEAAGVDTKKAVKDFVKNTEYAPDALGDFLNYGLPYFDPIGVSAGGALQMGDLSPNFEEGLMPALARFVGGAPAGLITKFGKAGEDASNGQYYRALEDIAPEIGRRALVTARVVNQGGFKTKDGVLILENPSVGDLVKYTIGFTPSKLQNAYDLNHSLRIFDENTQKETAGIYGDLAQAALEKDNEAKKALLLKAKSAGMELNPRDLLMQIAKRKNPKAYDILTTKKSKREEKKQVYKAYGK